MSPTDPKRPTPPTTAEVAALTARLRDLTARGRDVDPAERARFLADKNALIARITAADTSTGSALDTGQEVGDERDREFDALCERHPLPGDPGGEELEIGPDGGPQWFDPAPVDDQQDATWPVDEGWRAWNAAQGVTVDTAHHQITDVSAGAEGDYVPVRPVMPGWMREQARRTEAEIVAGTHLLVAPDDPARIAARIAELREHLAARGPEHLAEERREQLNRWHTDDTTHDGDTLTDGYGVPLIVTDDGPGLP